VFFFQKKYQYIVYKILGLGILFLQAIYQKHSWYYSWIYMVFPFAKLKKSSWFWILFFQSLLLVNYSFFLWLNRWVDLNFIKIIKYILPVVIILNESGIINKINRKRNSKTLVPIRV